MHGQLIFFAFEREHQNYTIVDTLSIANSKEGKEPQNNAKLAVVHNFVIADSM